MSAQGLTGAAGLTGGSGSFTLVQDEVAGIGLTAAIAANLFPASAKAALVSYLSLDNSTGLTLNNSAAEMARIFPSFEFFRTGSDDNLV